MKALPISKLIGIILSIILSCQWTSSVFSQVQTPRHIVIDNNIHGFYEYLPQGYTSGTQRFPLMVFLHGIGELGDGNANLPLVLHNGPPKLINNGSFPTSFTVNGQQFSFIVLSPQFIGWPAPEDINALIDYAVATYRVDTTRIYLTGLSMGGGAVWDYAGDVSFPYGKRLAAILPISGASYPDSLKGRVMAADNLPVWATQNQNDPTVPVTNTIGYINFINNPTPPNPPAKMSIFPVTGHDAWTHTYDPHFTEAGLNVYQWMLQFHTALMNPLPIILSDFELTPAGGLQVNINWVTSMEMNNAYFTLEHAADGVHFSQLAVIEAQDLASGSHYSYIDRGATAGLNYYRLSQTDLDGKSVDLGIKVITLHESTADNLVVFPNPARGSIFLQMNNDQTGNLKVNIFTSSGVLVKTLQADKENTFWKQQIGIDELSPGIYTVQVEGKLVKLIRNFVKQ